jgi:hypothetical protein
MATFMSGLRIHIEHMPTANTSGITHYLGKKGIPRSIGEAVGTRSRNTLVVALAAMILGFSIGGFLPIGITI